MELYRIQPPTTDQLNRPADAAPLTFAHGLGLIFIRTDDMKACFLKPFSNADSNESHFD